MNAHAGVTVLDPFFELDIDPPMDVISALILTFLALSAVGTNFSNIPVFAGMLTLFAIQDNAAATGDVTGDGALTMIVNTYFGKNGSADYDRRATGVFATTEDSEKEIDA